MARDAYESYEQNYTDLAVAERALGLLRDEDAALRTRMEALEQGFVRVQGVRMSWRDSMRCSLTTLMNFTMVW